MLQYNFVKPERIILTQSRLRERIVRRFPDAGLGNVAAEVLIVAEKAAQRNEQIRRPILPLRIACYALLATGLGIAIWVFSGVHVEGNNLTKAFNLLQFCESALAVVVFLGAAVIYLITLETRLKRKRALDALHELRAFAHVVDMHQLTKDPEGLFVHGPRTSQDDEQTTKSPYELNRYLNYCNEMLAIISKIAALYAQGFPDAPTVSAVDQVESLCTGLARKIWQKLMILDEQVEGKK